MTLTAKALLVLLLALPASWLVTWLRVSRRSPEALFRVRRRFPKIVKRLLALSSFLWLCLFWHFLTYGGIVDPLFLPPPNAVLAKLLSLLAGGAVYSDIAVSLVRISTGFLLAAVTGTALGCLAGASELLYSVIMPVNSYMRYIPPTVFISVLILWFGVGEKAKILLISLGIVFFVTQLVSDAMRAVPQKYIDACETLGAKPGFVFWRVLLPAAAPEIVVAWRVNMAGAWIFLVVAELIAAQRGLGYLIAVGQRFLNLEQVFAAIILIGVIGILTDLIFELTLRWCFSWRASA